MQGAGPYDPLGACALPLLISKMSIAALRAEVRKANTAYRNGEPIMSDNAYDQLLEQLRSKAPHAPELDSDATVLLSLDNQPFDYWYSSLPVGTTMVVQPKIDGCTLALRYVDGELVSAWTRSGRCAMETAMLVPSIPKTFKASGVIEVHGELYGIADGQSQKHAARALNRRPSGDGLVFCAFRLVGSQGSESCSMEDLRRRGFDVPDTLVCTFPRQVKELHQKWLDGQLFDSWPTDGIVVKVFDHAVQQKLGENSKAPFWALAMKRYA
tara:strand:- start:153 stop:959 length:807 start_codon:yes stop_codon:yes gene_type:complete